jgi:predicted dithiol-disulfide oxidoreductase (DUF899 family)
MSTPAAPLTKESNLPTPSVVDRAAFKEQLLQLRAREKAYTREGDALAAARRRLPMVEVDGQTALVGAGGDTTLLAAFEGRRQLIVYFHMWHDGKPAPEQCEGCTFFNGQVRELSVMHSRDVTYATLSVGPWEQIRRYREFLGLEAPWYHVSAEAKASIADGALAAYVRDGDKVFQTYATTARACEVMANSYGLLDLTVYGRQETWEDSPEGWPQPFGGMAEGNQFRIGNRPILQWPRVEAGRSDDLGASGD